MLRARDGRRGRGRHPRRAAATSLPDGRDAAPPRNPRSAAPGVRGRASPSSASGVPAHDDLAAGIAALRAQVDDPVGGADHVQVVLDHDQRMPRGDQPAEGARAAWRCRRSAGRSWARRRGRAACGRCRGMERAADFRRRLGSIVTDAPPRPGGRRASGAAPRRRRAWAPAGRAAGSRGPRRPAAAGARTTSGSPAKKASASVTVSSSTSAIDCARATFTSSTSAR